MLSRASSFIRFLAASICLLPLAAGAGDIQHEKTPYGTGSVVGFGIVKYDKTCVWFRVLFISGDFFTKLRPHKTPKGIEFKKEKTIYVNFPEQLVVDVEASPWKCPADPAEITLPDYAAGLMEKPSFEVAWKKDDESRPVELLATEEHHNRQGFGWSYLLTVHSAEVPLTDSLVIDMSMRQGLCGIHLVANLDKGKRSQIAPPCGWERSNPVN